MPTRSVNMKVTAEHATNKGQETTRIPNKLGGEKSPYLLQHQYNPVDWYPWGEEAFTKAKNENKPIFLSIGYDGATPSGNSVAAYVLQKIAHITANPKYREYSDKQLRFLAGQAKDCPAGYCFSQLVFLGALYPSKEIVCVVNNKDDNITTTKTVKKNSHENPEFEALKNYMANNYNPNMIVLVITEENQDELHNIAEYVKDYQITNDKTTYYICEDHRCQAPVNEL